MVAGSRGLTRISSIDESESFPFSVSKVSVNWPETSVKINFLPSHIPQVMPFLQQDFSKSKFIPAEMFLFHIKPYVDYRALQAVDNRIDEILKKYPAIDYLDNLIHPAFSESDKPFFMNFFGKDQEGDVDYKAVAQNYVDTHFSENIGDDFVDSLAEYLLLKYRKVRDFNGEKYFSKYNSSALGARFSLSRYDLAGDGQGVHQFIGYAGFKLGDQLEDTIYMNYVRYAGFITTAIDSNPEILHFIGRLKDFPPGQRLTRLQQYLPDLSIRARDNVLLALSEMDETGIPAPTLNDLPAKWKAPENREELLTRLRAVGFEGELPF